MLSSPPYKGLLPDRFWRASSASKHRFAVCRPWHKAMNIVLTCSEELELVPDSAYCIFHDGHEYSPILIDIARYPMEANVVMQLGKLTRTGNRALRYINLHKAYELLCRAPDARFSCIRHALAHSPHALSKPRTVDALIAQFGTKHIDLSNYAHQKVFWSNLGELLVRVDTLAGELISSVLQDCRLQSHHVEAITSAVAEHYFPSQYQGLLSNNSFKPKPLRGSA